MVKILRKIYKFTFRNRYLTPIIELKPQNLISYFGFWRDFFNYRRKGGKANLKDLKPQVGEKTKTTSIDPHYFYQGIWAFEKILKSGVKKHVDVGSQVSWVGLLTRIVHVIFVDIRPLKVDLDNLEIIKGNILHLPFPDNSVGSLSCLHVAEHVGLGRYGDQLDVAGTEKACEELSRILAPAGNLYFSLPIGRERTEFNAHRIHSPQTILSYFKNLQLKEFSVVNDKGNLIRNTETDNYKNARYSCGLFHFQK